MDGRDDLRGGVSRRGDGGHPRVVALPRDGSARGREDLHDGGRDLGADAVAGDEGHDAVLRGQGSAAFRLSAPAAGRGASGLQDANALDGPGSRALDLELDAARARACARSGNASELAEKESGDRLGIRVVEREERSQGRQSIRPFDEEGSPFGDGRAGGLVVLVEDVADDLLDEVL